MPDFLAVLAAKDEQAPILAIVLMLLLQHLATISHPHLPDNNKIELLKSKFFTAAAPMTLSTAL